MTVLNVDFSTSRSPAGWDETLYSADGEAGLVQSSYWARVLEFIDRASPYFVRVVGPESVVAQALVMKRYSFDRTKGRKRHPLPYLECIDGPVVLKDEHAQAATKAMLRWADRTARRALATRILFSPPHKSRYRTDESIATVYREFGYIRKPWATILVDLGPDEEELFKRLKHAARKCVNRCLREGLRVLKMRSFEEFRDTYWTIYAQSETYFGREAKPCFRQTWDEDVEGYYHYYVVLDSSDRVLACLGMYLFNGVATEIASALSSEAYERKLPAQDLIHWEMILEAKRMGCHTFDLAGVNPGPENQKEAGIRRFKEKWGGEYVEYNTYYKEMVPWLARVADRLNYIRNRIRESVSTQRS